METGNTAANQPRPTESEMNIARQLFDRGLNAILSASQLSGQVEELTAQVAEVRQSLERAQQNYALLDESYNRVRTERDDARREAQQVSIDLQGTTRQLEQANAEIGHMHRDISDLRVELAATKREADNYMHEAMKALDEANKLREALQVASDWAKGVTNLLNPPPAPSPSPSVQEFEPIFHQSSLGQPGTDGEVPTGHGEASNTSGTSQPEEPAKLASFHPSTMPDFLR